MSEHEIVFLLSDKKIIIELDMPLGEVDCCYRVPVCLIQDKTKVLLSNSTVSFDMQRLKMFLKKALNNELLLHESIVDDLGYMLNEYYQDESKFVKDTINGVVTWVGYRYRLWEAEDDKQLFVTWIYNDKKGEIVFEVTPFYPYLFCDPKKEPRYISYQNWIKDYKPYCVQKISKEVAQAWLNQAEQVVDQIEGNVARWEKEMDDK